MKMPPPASAPTMNVCKEEAPPAALAPSPRKPAASAFASVII